MKRAVFVCAVGVLLAVGCGGGGKGPEGYECHPVGKHDAGVSKDAGSMPPKDGPVPTPFASPNAYEWVDDPGYTTFGRPIMYAPVADGSTVFVSIDQVWVCPAATPPSPPPPCTQVPFPPICPDNAGNPLTNVCVGTQACSCKKDGCSPMCFSATAPPPTLPGLTAPGVAPQQPQQKNK